MFARTNIRTMKDLVYTAAQRFGDDSFMRWKEKKEIIDRSYNRFKEDSDAVAVWLENTLPPHSHAVLIGGTCYEYVVAWFGISNSANVSVPLSPANSIEALADEINRSDSVAIFVDKAHEQNIGEFKKLCPQVTHYIILSGSSDNAVSMTDIIDEYRGEEPKSEVKPEMLTAIIFTSGTTGKSKGVMLSHANLVDNATCEVDKGYHGDKRLSILPVHHIFCFVCDIAATFWFGRIVCINDSLMRIPKNLQLFKPKHATVVPMMAASLLNRMRQMSKTNPDKIAVGKEMFGEDFMILYVGGSYLSPEIIHGYAEFGIEVAQGYGMTECAARISTGIKDCPKPESVGLIVTGCTVKTVDGEIWVKSPSVMMGYYKNPEETAKTLTEDGWLKTGDLGYADDDGFVHLTGRKKNLIILSNGENVSPEELENKFALSLPIKEIIVYGKGDLLVAEVYPNPDYETNDIKADIQSEIDAVNETLPSTHQIHGFVIRDTEFEKTASRKIKRTYTGI